MRKLLRASVLVLVLAIPAFAGDIPNGVAAPPPSNTTQPGDIPNGVTGEIPYGVTSSEPTTTEILIDLLFALVS
jgi:hypothetical protein